MTKLFKMLLSNPVLPTNTADKVKLARKYNLTDMLESVNTDNLQNEISTGYAVGNEIIDDDYNK